ncbi:interactor of HORMAD1 protein 1 [Trematomus bernacchii]|uniref:interactor of HORMAD1 protein 1 n=1 Tax=Trematomus bernacchii TaxID=40690 RepID=UPI00146C92D5|nr:interactor of HORMAD1 protein 1 [Trematomus bernacchii]
MSQEMSLSSRNSQQSSQEGSDPKFISSYHTKPFLFGELKDKSKALGILDKFEEDKKRAKEQTDSDILAKECNHFRETLNNIQQLVAGTEKNTYVCQTVLQKFDSFSSTMQTNINSLQIDISQQFEALLTKVNSQKELMAELEDKMQKACYTTVAFGSNLQGLKDDLGCLREEQERERNMLEEALKLLSTLVSEHSAKASSERVTDSANQTSPELEQSFSNILQENKLEGTQLICKSYNRERNQAQVPPQGGIIGKRKVPQRGQRKCRKRPLVLSQRSKGTVTNENSQPLKGQHVTTPRCERRDPNMVPRRDHLVLERRILPTRKVRSIAEGCYITPLSCWSQDSNSSIFAKPSAESKAVTPVRPEGLWQLFDIDGSSDLGY